MSGASRRAAGPRSGAEAAARDGGLGFGPIRPICRGRPSSPAQFSFSWGRFALVEVPRPDMTEVHVDGAVAFADGGDGAFDQREAAQLKENCWLLGRPRQIGRDRTKAQDPHRGPRPRRAGTRPRSRPRRRAPHARKPLRQQRDLQRLRICCLRHRQRRQPAVAIGLRAKLEQRHVAAGNHSVQSGLRGTAVGRDRDAGEPQFAAIGQRQRAAIARGAHRHHPYRFGVARGILRRSAARKQHGESARKHPP